MKPTKKCSFHLILGLCCGTVFSCSLLSSSLLSSSFSEDSEDSKGSEHSEDLRLSTGSILVNDNLRDHPFKTSAYFSRFVTPSASLANF